MLNVFLIDDEKLILKGLEQIIDWTEAGFHLAGCFTQARKAMDAARRERPDIIMTDIRMPGCSGLDLIATLKKELPDTLFVVLSAYDSFEYAQQALHLGAFRYLLKPIEKSDLLETLVEARAEILRKQLESKSEMGQQDRQMQSYLIREWLLNGVQPPMDSKRTPVLQLSSKPFRLLFCFCPIRMNDDFSYESVPPPIRQIIFDSIDAVYQPDNQFFHAGIFVALLDDGGQEKQVPIQVLHELIIKKTQRQPLIYLTTGTSTLSDGHAFFQDAFSIFRTCVFFEKEIANIQIESDVSDKVACAEKELVRSLNQADHDGIRHIFQMLLRDCSPDHSLIDRQSVLSIYRALQDFVYQYCCQIDPKHISALPLLPLAEFLTHRDLSTYMTQFVLKELEVISRQFTANKSTLVARAKLHIESHFDDPDLKLASVSQQLYVNYSYLSHLFNTETGLSFNQYLTRVRLEHACKLLVNSPLSILEIAGRVGYSDIKNFFRVFKKQYGQSPQRYRQNQTDSNPG